jgi:xanthine dehydrogenase molybdopterin-binding subunit B
VDYDQLKIKNTEYVHYLHEGNSSLLVEKTNVMHSMRQHNSAVNHLQGATKVQQDLENHLVSTLSPPMHLSLQFSAHAHARARTVFTSQACRQTHNGCSRSLC